MSYKQKQRPAQEPALTATEIVDRLELAAGSIQLDAAAWSRILLALIPEWFKDAGKPVPMPADALPGTFARLETLALRFSLGLQLFHPSDPGVPDHLGVLPRVAAGGNYPLGARTVGHQPIEQEYADLQGENRIPLPEVSDATIRQTQGDRYSREREELEQRKQSEEDAKKAITRVVMIQFPERYLGMRLKLARQRKKWSQEYLARRVKVRQCCVTHWESGRRTPGRPALARLARVFDVSVPVLLRSCWPEPVEG